MSRPLAAAVVVAVAFAAQMACADVRVAGEKIQIRNARLSATFADGVLVGLTNKLTGEDYIPEAPSQPGQVTGVLYIGAKRWTAPGTPGAGASVRMESGAAAARFGDFGGATGNTLTMLVAEDPPSGDIVLTQDAGGAEKGCYGVQWGISGVSDEYDIIVPGRSGIKITRADSPGSYSFGYPSGWECQFVIVQGEKGGFCVWAEDSEGAFKDLSLRRRRHRWQIGFATQNPAPFDDLTAAKSVRWRLFTYEGDWRVPARRYRDWAERAFGLTRLADQRPSWVKDIRFLSIVGMSHELIEALAKQVDPKQTLLYVPGWRRDGYDRNYPDYSALEEFGPFLQRAHELGFHVMAHVNYFGCDPLNELYAKFEKRQFRDPFSGARQWWTWDRADPPIKFAYINPAAKEWRELFVSRMKELCAKYPLDALHLDQTICITNTSGGLIDGLNSIQGNVLLHEELREALPNVALSGEGLDEVTFRHEAFAQRHVWGVNHVEGTWNRAYLKMAHAVSSYILTPYTTIYGYLGMANPGNAQLYAAWREAYRNWGVIPTYARPSLAQLAKPKEFVAQALAEARFFQESRLDPALDGKWPADVAFPYKGEGRIRAAYRFDQGTVLVAERPDGGRDDVTRVITGVESVSLPGRIDGWMAYDEERIFGLNPSMWYAYSPAPRDEEAFHIAALPKGMTVTSARTGQGITTFSLADATRKIADFCDLASSAKTGYQRFGEEATEFEGMFQDDDSGAHLIPGDDVLQMHPPWRRSAGEEGDPAGVTFAEYTLTLPKAEDIEFLSEVAMAEGAVGEGKTDGVLYSVTVTSGKLKAEKELLNATAEKQALNLDLARFAGRKVTVRLQAHPGPAHNISFDWARWYDPRIEVDTFRRGVARVVCPAVLRVALAAEGEVSLRADARPGRYSVSASFPNTIYLLGDPPPAVELPLSLRERELRTVFVGDDGRTLAAPQFAAATPAECSCGGQARQSIFAHPPDHGRTVIEFPMTLPDRPAELVTYVGLRDGSKSEGCSFIVQANGKTLFRRLMLPEDGWQEARADLADYAGKAVVLSLVTDSEGSFYFDWACWGEPVIRAK